MGNVPYIFLILLSCCSFLLQGCVPAIIGVGAGVGVGAAAYYDGELSKIYMTDYHRAVDAGIATLTRLKITPMKQVSDELKTEIAAQRPNGTSISLEVERIDSKQTKISVRTGTIGVREKHVSKQIHEFIEQRLVSEYESLNKNQTDRAIKEPYSKPDNKITEKENKKEDREIKSNLKENTTLDDKSSLAIQGAEKLENKEIVIIFQKDSNIIQKKTQEKLDEIAAFLEGNPKATITITGFPDSGGSLAYKNLLSDSRAKTIKNYFVSKGVNPDRVETIVSTSVGKITNQGASIKVINSTNGAS